MTLHQLRIFRTVARLGSFSRAAEELGVTQPAVSIQVADLARTFGVDLFEQRGRRIYLTEAGRVLDGYAERLLALLKEATEAVQATGSSGPKREQTAGSSGPKREEAGLGQPFEVIEHTADVGIIARGATLPDVFANAAAGMMAFVIPPAEVRAAEVRRVTVDADDREGLLIAWLNELVLLLNGEGFVPREFRILEFADTRLVAEVGGEPVDPRRHRFHLDVKAATYHQVEIARNGEWHAKVIFDV